MPLLRPATLSDEPFLFGLTSRLADFPLPAWRTGEEIARADDAILLQALHHPDPGNFILIAEEPEGRPAGYVFATTDTDYFTRQSHAHIEIVAVSPDVERTGLGRLLLDAAETWARSRGYGSITLNVFARNQRAIRVYEHLGYAPETVHYWKAL